MGFYGTFKCLCVITKLCDKDYIYLSYWVTSGFFETGMLSLVDDVQQSCTSLRTISIPLPLTLSIQNYFIEFFLVGSGQHPLSWLHIAEIRFSDMAPTTSIPTNTGKYCN